MAGRLDYQWLHEAARMSLAGPSSREVQELFLPEILAGEAWISAANPADAVEGVHEFTHWALHVARLIPGEFPQEALWSLHVTLYVDDVSDGGHGQYFGNMHANPVALGACERGLKAIGSDEHAAIFRDFRTFIDADPRRAAKVAAAAGFGKQHPGIVRLDDRFYDADHPACVALHAAWLRALPCLRSLPFADVQTERERVAAANTLAEKRAAEVADAIRSEELKRFDIQIAEKLCTKAGLAFQHQCGPGNVVMAIIYGIRGVDYGYSLPIKTDRGEVCVFFLEGYGFLKQPTAVLTYMRAPQPLKTLAISKQDYESAVPEYFRERLSKGPR